MSFLLSAKWSAWTDWTQCTPVCPKSIEYRHRTRECKIPYNPKNQYKIKNECLGQNKEFKPCTPMIDCQSELFAATTTTTELPSPAQWHQRETQSIRQFFPPPPPLPPFLSAPLETATTTAPIESTIKSNTDSNKWQEEWSAWSDCSISCGVNVEGYQLRKRKCEMEKCEEEIRSCYPTLPCPIEPPTMWSEWTKCSTQCGNGTRSRIRYCSKKSYDFPCEGKELIMEKTLCTSYVGCSSSSSSPSPSPSSNWSAWSDWSPCSVGCGQGYSSRQRVCPTDAHCQGSPQEIKPCTDTTQCSNPSMIYPNRLNGFGSYIYNAAASFAHTTSTAANSLLSSLGSLAAIGGGAAEKQLNSYTSFINNNNNNNEYKKVSNHQLSIHEICSKYCNENDKKYNDPLCVNFVCNQTSSSSISGNLNRYIFGSNRKKI